MPAANFEAFATWGNQIGSAFFTVKISNLMLSEEFKAADGGDEACQGAGHTWGKTGILRSHQYAHLKEKDIFLQQSFTTIPFLSKAVGAL